METKAPFEKFIIYVGTDPNIFCVIVQGDGVQYETLSPILTAVQEIDALEPLIARLEAPTMTPTMADEIMAKRIKEECWDPDCETFDLAHCQALVGLHRMAPDPALEELRKMVEQATPGEWQFTEVGDEAWIAQTEKDGGHLVCDPPERRFKEYADRFRRDAPCIVACVNYVKQLLEAK